MGCSRKWRERWERKRLLRSEHDSTSERRRCGRRRHSCTCKEILSQQTETKMLLVLRSVLWVGDNQRRILIFSQISIFKIKNNNLI